MVLIHKSRSHKNLCLRPTIVQSKRGHAGPKFSTKVYAVVEDGSETCYFDDIRGPS